MIEEIDRLKSEIPAGEWEATPESVRKVLEMLQYFSVKPKAGRLGVHLE
jgi:hypothetical protein